MNLQHPNVILIGTGVVGCAILQAHIDAKVSLRVADQDEASLADAVARLQLDRNAWAVSDVQPLRDGLPSIAIEHRHAELVDAPTIVIESIAERLNVKQDFFREVQSLFGDNAVLCSNTSTLRITDIADGLSQPEQLCGMHFFMPVVGRPAVEVVQTAATRPSAIAASQEHVRRINKSPLVVKDSPGFIVNRLLSPYLNEALLLLGRGVSEDQLERASQRYGMPMSPLELIDWIGTRTMIDAGRVFWQSFPTRVDPSPVLGAMVKAQRMGRACGAGMYDYDGGVRSKNLPAFTTEVCQRYQRNVVELSDEQVMLLLAIPMWIEAALAFRDRVTDSVELFNLAMSGGLGFQSNGTWLEFFESVGSQRMLAAIGEFSPTTKSLRVSDELLEELAQNRPTRALERYAQSQ